MPAATASVLRGLDRQLDRVLGGRFVVQVVVVYAITRIVTAVMLAVVAPTQAPAGMTGGTTVGYFGFTRLWDGEWYDRVATDGYPAVLLTCVVLLAGFVLAALGVAAAGNRLRPRAHPPHSPPSP